VRNSDVAVVVRVRRRRRPGSCVGVVKGLASNEAVPELGVCLDGLDELVTSILPVWTTALPLNQIGLRKTSPIGTKVQVKGLRIRVVDNVGSTDLAASINGNKGVRCLLSLAN